MNNQNEELIDLVEEEIDQENRTFEEIIKELSQWKSTFPNQTPQQVKNKLENQQINEEERRKYLSKIQRLEELLTSRSKSAAIRKKETKLCEICQQIRQDNFEYSRISNRGFNVSRIYRICSFCQKTVQKVVDNKDINPIVY